MNWSALIFREISDLLTPHTSLPGERLALADARRSNATPRLRCAALPTFVWSPPRLSSCHTGALKATLHLEWVYLGDLERDILRILNLEDVPRQRAFQIERSRGVIVGSVG